MREQLQFDEEPNGKRAVQDILTKLNFVFETEKTFDGCISDKGTKLRFDVYVPSLDLIIEYRGEEHFQYSPFFFKTEEQFKCQQKLDDIKRNYAVANHSYLEISYKSFDDIEELVALVIARI